MVAQFIYCNKSKQQWFLFRIFFGHWW